MDVVGASISPEHILHLELPLVMDMLKAKVRLEESKSKAQKLAAELGKHK